MRLNQAITHCYKIAEQKGTCQCAKDHRQLAHWLEELKVLRADNKRKRNACRRSLALLRGKQ